MTKAKTATKSAADAKKTAGKGKAKKAEPKAVAKPAKADKKTADKEKSKPAAKPAAKTAAKTAAKPAAKKPAKHKETEKLPEKRTPRAPEPAPAEKPASGNKTSASFTNAGLGVKIASKKPALSVAPGVMILGKPVAAKTEPSPRQSDRRLSKKEQQEIKSFLLERRERLLAGMRRELAMQKERAESKAADEVDKATDAYDEDLSFEIATANDQELEEIQVALEKIEKGTYGECEICGCGISPSRLKVLPSATTCVSCRGQEEMARRRDDGSPAFSMIAGEDGESDAETM